MFQKFLGSIHVPCVQLFLACAEIRDEKISTSLRNAILFLTYEATSRFLRDPSKKEDSLQSGSPEKCRGKHGPGCRVGWKIENLDHATWSKLPGWCMNGTGKSESRFLHVEPLNVTYHAQSVKGTTHAAPFLSHRDVGRGVLAFNWHVCDVHILNHPSPTCFGQWQASSKRRHTTHRIKRARKNMTLKSEKEQRIRLVHLKNHPKTPKSTHLPMSKTIRPLLHSLFLQRRPPRTVFLAGCVAGSGSALINGPTELVKVLAQTNLKNKGTLSAPGSVQQRCSVLQGVFYVLTRGRWFNGSFWG